MTLIQELRWRGMIQDIMPGTEELFEKEQVSGYIGFDPTSDSLHIGSLVPILLLVHLQKAGHKPFALVGGATGMVGDPSGKSEERNLLSEETLAHNIAGVKKQLSHFLNFDSTQANAAEMVNNYDWFKDFNFLSFIREVGKHITVNYMMAKDSVKKRIEGDTGMSFTEFTYQLIQGYDFYWLYKNKNCKVQMGGSDQWGNIVSGIDLIHKASGKEVFGITTPLLTTSSGSKMGKSLSGAVWLNEDNLSPYDYFQYWRNVEDPDVVRFAKLYTEWDNAQISELEKLAGSNINEAKKQLAHRVTELCHGKEAADSALETAKLIFEQGGAGGDLPVFYIDKEVLSKGIPCFELFHLAGISDSKSEARKLIRGAGAKVNDEKIEDENLVIDLSFIKDGSIKLSSGKKKHILVSLL